MGDHDQFRLSERPPTGPLRVSAGPVVEQCANRARRAWIVFAKACELGLEGIVSKRAGSFYKSGPSRNWLKTKNPDFVRT